MGNRPPLKAATMGQIIHVDKQSRDGGNMLQFFNRAIFFFLTATAHLRKRGKHVETGQLEKKSQ